MTRKQRVPRAAKALPPQDEGDIQRAILDLAAMFPGVELWRQNAGTVRVRGGYRAGAPVGASDLCGVVRGGRALFIEVKRPGESAEPHQVEWLDRMRALGAVVAVVHSVQEAAAVLREVTHG